MFAVVNPSNRVTSDFSAARSRTGIGWGPSFCACSDRIACSNSGCECKKVRDTLACPATPATVAELPERCSSRSATLGKLAFLGKPVSKDAAEHAGGLTDFDEVTVGID